MHDDRLANSAGPAVRPDAGRRVGDPATRPAGHASETGSDAANVKKRRPARHPDPTRYGDWEKDGRCIDF